MEVKSCSCLSHKKISSVCLHFDCSYYYNERFTCDECYGSHHDCCKEYLVSVKRF